MDIPLFHLDYFNNRMLIAVIAILHVVINHAMAVGGLPLITWLEWKGYRAKDSATSARWDRLAYRLLFVFFVVTTTLGAMTGVGIWFSVSLVNPMAIGSLIRVFFWGWFTEWLVFVTEVSLILFYFLTWRRWAKHKLAHVWVGVTLSVASWVTMAIITAILGFMMDPGNWLTDRSLLQGLANPLYLPQLAFRTNLAMVMAGCVCLCLIPFFTRGDQELRQQASATVSRWSLYWLPFLICGALVYWQVVPQSMLGNLPVANGTQEFANWLERLAQLIAIVALVATAILVIGAVGRWRLPVWMALLPFLLMAALLGHFERVREFIRKPYAIGNYLYANGIRVDDYPLLKRDGLLRHSTYASVHEITPENQLRAGKELFALTCTRCHTSNGINGIRGKLRGMYGDSTWQADQIAGYLEIMHNTRGYMPPFPGTTTEARALAAYLVSLQHQPDSLPGAQNTGTALTEGGRTP